MTEAGIRQPRRRIGLAIWYGRPTLASGRIPLCLRPSSHGIGDRAMDAPADPFPFAEGIGWRLHQSVGGDINRSAQA